MFQPYVKERKINIFCKICQKELINVRALAAHLRTHNILIQEYYDNFYKRENEGLCERCFDKTSFRGFITGYFKYCSQSCSSKSEDVREKISKSKTGIKQGSEQIRKRVFNTNQKLKEQIRKQTNLNRYGVDNPTKLKIISNKISVSNIGKKCVRTPEHQQKIIESKRNNKTLNHKSKTKDSIRNSLLILYQTENSPCTISNNFGGHHKTGYCGKFFYRSSYELIFINYCIINDILLESAETKEFRVRYQYLGKNHFYYPDFYLPDYDVVIEIKPNSKLLGDVEQIKIHEGMKVHNNFTIIDEESLLNLDEVFSYFERI